MVGWRDRDQVWDARGTRRILGGWRRVCGAEPNHASPLLTPSRCFLPAGEPGAAPGGALPLHHLRPAPFPRPHYAQEAFGWSLRHAACGDAFHYFLYVMCKGQPLTPSQLALGERLWHPLPPPSPPPPLAEEEDEDYLLAIQL